MQAFGWMTIVALLAIGVCLLAGVWAVLSSLGRGRGSVSRGTREAAAHGRAACGRCGHEVEATATTCPECGTPYALAGTATPALLVRSGAPAWLAAVLLAVPAVAAAVLLFGVVERAIPMVVTPAPPASASRDAVVELTSTRGSGGPAAYMLTHELDVHGSERTEGTPPDERASFEPTSGEGVLRVSGPSTPDALLRHDFQTDRWEVQDRSGRSPRAITTGRGLPAGVAALFAHAGLDQRNFARAEMHEAIEWFEYQYGAEPPNGFAAVGPAGESTGPDDTALRPTGRRSESLSFGVILVATRSPSPLAKPLGLLAGGVPVLAWVVGIALVVRARRRVIRGGA